MEAFQVYARIRPLNQKELQAYSGRIAASQIDDYTLAVGDSESRQTFFQVDQVFNQTITNEDIFQMSLQPLVSHFLSGINSTILAYGITGAGKSHTMFGSQGDGWQAGIIELALEYLFGEVDFMNKTKISLSYMEIYNEQVFDLLKPNGESLQILDDPVMGVVVNDLEEVEIHSSRSAQSLIELGNTRRMVAETKANQFSSRSHAIVQITLERVVEDGVLSAKLSLVDLAGSERQNVYSQQKGLRNLEGSNINRSLLTLGNCITALSEKKKGCFVPYRDSKLTRLLKDSLGGNTKTAMIACISPSLLSYQQTVNTMKYACRARKIEKVVHQNVRDVRTSDDLKKQIFRLRKQLEIKQQGQSVDFTKGQMQTFISKLIKNVEKLTMLRCGESSELRFKMQEIELMEEQNWIVNGMLSRCKDEPMKQRQIAKSVTEDSNSNRLKAVNFAKLPNNEDFNVIKAMNKVKKLNEPAEIDDIIEKEFSRPINNETTMGNIFIKGNLQNVRLRHHKEKKIVRDLVAQYISLEEFSSARQKVIQKARQLLEVEGQRKLLGADDRHILLKMAQNQSLDQQDLTRYHVGEKKPSFCEPEQKIQSKDHNIGLAIPNNRFLSSLQEVRRMMRIVSGTVDKVEQVQQCFNDGEGQWLSCSRRLLFEQ